VDTALATPGYGHAAYLRHFVICTYCALCVKHSPLRDDSVLGLHTLSYRTRLAPLALPKHTPCALSLSPEHDGRSTPNNPLQGATEKIGGYARKPEAQSTREARRIPSRLMGVQNAAVEGSRTVSYCLVKSKRY
jgi:hypothetical protein